MEKIIAQLKIESRHTGSKTVKRIRSGGGGDFFVLGRGDPEQADEICNPASGVSVPFSTWVERFYSRFYYYFVSKGKTR